METTNFSSLRKIKQRTLKTALNLTEIKRSLHGSPLLRGRKIFGNAIHGGLSLKIRKNHEKE